VAHLLPWIPWATPEAPTLEEAGALISRWVAQRAAGENFIYAVFRRDDGRLLGGMGLYARVGAGRLEVGYWIRKSESGRGYATEAAAALSAVGLGLPGVVALEIHTDPANHASRRVPEKLGYRLLDAGARTASDAAGPPRNTVVHERLRGEERFPHAGGPEDA